MEKSNELIKKYKNNLFLNETQIFRKNSKNLNCLRHFKVFNEFLYDGNNHYLEEDSTGKSSSFYVMEGDDV